MLLVHPALIGEFFLLFSKVISDEVFVRFFESHHMRLHTPYDYFETEFEHSVTDMLSEWL